MPKLTAKQKAAKRREINAKKREAKQTPAQRKRNKKARELGFKNDYQRFKAKPRTPARPRVSTIQYRSDFSANDFARRFTIEDTPPEQYETKVFPVVKRYAEGAYKVRAGALLIYRFIYQPSMGNSGYTEEDNIDYSSSGYFGYNESDPDIRWRHFVNNFYGIVGKSLNGRVSAILFTYAERGSV